jgi:hypothetical protein
MLVRSDVGSQKTLRVGKPHITASNDENLHVFSGKIRQLYPYICPTTINQRIQPINHGITQDAASTFTRAKKIDIQYAKPSFEKIILYEISAEYLVVEYFNKEGF